MNIIFIYLKMHGKFQQLSTKPQFLTKIAEQLFLSREILRLLRYFAVSQNLMVNFKFFPENNRKFLCYRFGHDFMNKNNKSSEILKITAPIRTILLTTICDVIMMVMSREKGHLEGI